MRYVKKFIICVFLSLVSIIPIHSVYADSCEIDVIAATGRKWRNINAQPMLSRDHSSSASLSVYDDMEIIQRYKARVPVLLEQYNNELERPLAGQISGTIIGAGYYECEAGQTIKECDERVYLLKKEQNADRADGVARDEYTTYMKSQYCGTNGGSDGGTLVTGHVDNAPVVNASAQSQELMNTIYNQKLAMTLGMSFVYSASDLKRINTYMNDWDRACERVSKPKHADTTGFKNIPEGGKTKHICVIKTCKSQYTVSDDGLSCIKQNRSSGGGSTPAPASSSGGGSTSSSGGSAATSYQQIRDFIDDGARNISVGSSIVVKSDIIRGSAGVREHVNMWDEACTNLRNKPDRAATTGPKITTEGDDTRHTCIIKTCRGRGYEPAAGGTACALNESGDATTPASSSGGETLMRGSVDNAPVVDASAQSQELMNTIYNQKLAMTLGMSFVYSASDLKRINTYMNDWDRACERVSKPQKADTTGFKNIPEGGKTKHICVIKTCKSQYTVSDDGLSCIKQNRSSGGGSNTSRDDLADDNQMINNQINKSTGRGNMSRDGGGVSGRGIGAIITEVNTAANNIQIGTPAFSYPESMVSSGGMQLQTAIANWINRCIEYPQTHDSSAIKTTKHDKTTEGGTVRHTCAIEACQNHYVKSEDGKSCQHENSSEIATLAPRTLPPAEIERLPDREMAPVPELDYAREVEDWANNMFIGSHISFTRDELKQAKLAAAVELWERKCNSYPEDSDDVTINSTYVKKDSHRKQNDWYCLIKTCSEDEAGYPQNPSEDGQSCISQNGQSCSVGDRHADQTHYDLVTKSCVIDTCKENYTLVDGRCEKTSRLERAASRLERDFTSDLDKLARAFEQVVNQITEECERSGGHIAEGVCEGATKNSTPPARGSNNRRGSGRR